MKKYIILMLSILMAISMTACGNEPEPEVPDIDTPVIEQEDNELVREIDQMVEDAIGEYVLATSYGDGIYSILVTCNGIKDSVGTSTFEDVCISFDEVTVAINEDTGIDCMVFIASDKDKDEILYITYNGKDVTNYIG
jgi:predicted small lipoprotein YifL